MLTDPLWQEAATENAAKGYPYAVWGSVNGRPLTLLDSKKTRDEAERFAEHERRNLRPKGQWLVIVCDESQPLSTETRS